MLLVEAGGQFRVSNLGKLRARQPGLGVLPCCKGFVKTGMSEYQPMPRHQVPRWYPPASREEPHRYRAEIDHPWVAKAIGFAAVYQEERQPRKDVFVRLFEQGLIYRGKRLVNWDPVLGTSVSDLEVESVEEDGRLWHINYPLVDGSGNTIALQPLSMEGNTGLNVAGGIGAITLTALRR